MIPVNFQESIFFATIRITIPQETGTETSIGTGFLLNASFNDGTNRVITLLISNKHVFVNPKGSISFTLNTKFADGTPNLGNKHTFNQIDFSPLYTEHPDPNVDLACINASAITQKDLGIYYRYLLPSMISDFSEINLMPGLDVWFVGYPENRFDIINNLPLMRRGYIASLPKIDFNSKKQFVIDAQVFPGSSGSPVFVQMNNEFKLIGIVTETMIKHGYLQAIPTVQAAVGVQQILGLGIVIKATLLKELIDIAVERVKEIIKSRPVAITQL